jgi:limonene 1,2-monooxygenase
MTAQRIVLLDHLTRGRVMLGVGPGALPSDAFMLGIDPADQRSRMEEALECILALFRSDEPITRKTEWFTLEDARLHLEPYTKPHPEVAVAAMISPSGPRAAGRFGVALLSIGATQREGFDLLGQHWNVVEERAVQFDQPADRKAWRLVSQIHIAETREQAYRDVEFGLADYFDYFRRVAALPFVPEGSAEDLAEQINQSGVGVVGTPDDVIDLIERLIEQSDGGFGTFLVQAHEWADTAATHKSYELLARYVMPRFQGSATRPTESRDWVAENRPQFIGAAGQAIMTAIQDHHAEKSS